MPASAPDFCGGRHVARVVLGGEDARLPLVGELGLVAERRDHRVGRRKRTADPSLGLGHAEEGGAARDMRAGARLAPGQRVELVLDRKAEQLVPCRVEHDRVDAGSR